MLEFVEEGHVYKWQGSQVPSVTQVLREWVKTRFGYVNTASGDVVDVEIFESAADFGTAVHMGAKLILSTGLDWDALDPALVEPLKQFAQWLADYKVFALHVEQPIYSAQLGIAGTPDIIATVKGVKHVSIIDIKTGLINEMVGPQTAGYELLYRHSGGYKKPIVRHELIIPRDGSPYRFKMFYNPADKDFFLSRLFQYRYLNS